MQNAITFAPLLIFAHRQNPLFLARSPHHLSDTSFSQNLHFLIYSRTVISRLCYFSYFDRFNNRLCCMYVRCEFKPRRRNAASCSVRTRDWVAHIFIKSVCRLINTVFFHLIAVNFAASSVAGIAKMQELNGLRWFLY